MAETLLSGVVIAAVLTAMCMVSGSLRTGDAEARTRDILTSLMRALRTYHAQHGLIGETSEGIVARLLADKVSAPSLAATLPLRRDDEERLLVLDGFGTPVAYRLPADQGAPLGEFISAGPDRQFGDPFADDPTKRRAAADNIHGSELEALQP